MTREKMTIAMWCACVPVTAEVGIIEGIGIIEMAPDMP